MRAARGAPQGFALRDSCFAARLTCTAYSALLPSSRRNIWSSMDTVLFHAFIYLVAAVVAVPLAKQLGLGSVLGYLLAGTMIGPHVLNLVGEQTDHVMHFAEFGVVMMLFLVGLE